MPLPTAPPTTFSDALVPNPGGVGSGIRVRASKNASELFPTDGSVINLSGSWDVTQAIPASAQRAVFIIEAAAGSTAAAAGAPIARFWQDGTYPTTASGLPVYDGQPVEINGYQNLQNCRLISTDGFAHTINVQFFDDLA